MSLRDELARLRVALEGLRPRVAVPLLILPGVLAARCEHDPECAERCINTPMGADGEFLLYSDGSTRPWAGA